MEYTLHNYKTFPWTFNTPLNSPLLYLTPIQSAILMLQLFKIRSLRKKKLQVQENKNEI